MPTPTKPTKRSVSDIKAHLLRPATTSHFEVDIPVPGSTNFRNRLGIQKEKLQLMCDSASLPGSNLATPLIMIVLVLLRSMCIVGSLMIELI
jgi:hypothetical protein